MDYDHTKNSIINKVNDDLHNVLKIIDREDEVSLYRFLFNHPDLPLEKLISYAEKKSKIVSVRVLESIRDFRTDENIDVAIEIINANGKQELFKHIKENPELPIKDLLRYAKRNSKLNSLDVLQAFDDINEYLQT